MNVTGPTTVVATRSTDLGVTWSQPKIVATADPHLMTWVDAALAPDGTVYVGWQRVADPLSIRVMVSKSSDGGSTWHKPAVVATAPGAPMISGGDADGTILVAPALAVAGNGTVGVLFYDHRNDAPGTDPSRVTDLWLRTSSDGGRSWRERHVAGPFDETTAPSLAADSNNHGLPGRAAGGFVGDYQSLVPFAGGFAGAFTLARTRSANDQQTDWFANPTDIYWSHLPI
jgi:hypothetical protein